MDVSSLGRVKYGRQSNAQAKIVYILILGTGDYIILC